jgi:hypothetical protein
VVVVVVSSPYLSVMAKKIALLALEKEKHWAAKRS